MNDTELVLAAAHERKKAYAPYSGFAVGAALLCDDGSVYTGCNIENASYGAALCAERTAFCKAVADGRRSFLRMAIVGGKEGSDELDICPPCGICRQVMAEFCDPCSFEIILSNGAGRAEKYRLADILPRAFSGYSLRKGRD